MYQQQSGAVERYPVPPVEERPAVRAAARAYWRRLAAAPDREAALAEHYSTIRRTGRTPWAI